MSSTAPPSRVVGGREPYRDVAEGLARILRVALVAVEPDERLAQRRDRGGRRSGGITISRSMLPSTATRLL